MPRKYMEFDGVLVAHVLVLFLRLESSPIFLDVWTRRVFCLLIAILIIRLKSSPIFSMLAVSSVEFLLLSREGIK